MNSKKLFNAIGNIEDRYIAEEAEQMPVLRKKTNYRSKRVATPFVRWFALAACVVFFVCALTFGATFADDIKEFVSVVLSTGDGKTHFISDIATVKINDSAIISENFLSMTVADAEKTLGVDILTTPKATSQILSYSTGLSGEKIGQVHLWYAGFIDYPRENAQIDSADTSSLTEEEYQTLMSSHKDIAMDIILLTPYAGQEYIQSYKTDISADGGKKVESTNHLNNLDVDALIFTNDWSDTRLSATFVYNNMLYTIIGNSIQLDEMLDILQSLN
jgi:hypothetical protein